MFYWMKRNSGGSETLDSLGNMSKAEILRGIVTEKLATAAQEILAVVERTVAGYEEEASGFRLEIDRQRRQLELLQPRVKLERRVKALNPNLDSHEVVVSDEDEEERQHTQQQVVEDTGTLGLLWFDDDDDDDDNDDDGEGEEEQSLMQPATSSRQKREDLKDPDYQIPSRSFSPRVGSDRRRPGRPRVSDTQNHLDLRIRILEGSQADVLSKSAFKKFPMLQLQCPRGLQEADFLNLLRSTYPQLTADKPFDIFTSDRSRRLQPLRVRPLTAEEICRTIRSTGAGNSTLYIRLKTGEETQTSSEDLHPPQTQDDATKDPPSSSATMSDDQMENYTRLSSPRDQSDRRKRGRPRLGEEPTHHYFRICILEDSQSDMVSKNVISVKTSVQEVKCPRGLQEADFLNLLRSTFPELAGDDRPLDIFKADRGRRLQRLKVKTLTPVELYRTMKSTGVGSSTLYIRLKREEEEEDEELHLLRRNDDATDDSPSTERLSSPRDQSDRRKRGRPRLGEEPTHHYFRICILEDSQSDMVSKNVISVKTSVQEVKCPRGLQEADFLDLLRSTFPELAGDDRPLDIFKADRGRRLQRLKVKTLTPVELYRTMKSTGVGSSTLYIRLKAGEEDEDEDLHLLRRNDDATDDDPSTFAMGMKSDEARLRSSSSTSQQQEMETEEADDEDAGESEVDTGDENNGDEVCEGDDDWKPDPELRSPKMMRRRRGPKTSSVEKSKTPCKVCGVWYRVLGSLIKHAWSHMDEPQCVCGVCGEHFESVEELKGHLRNYQKTHDCSYCGKSFFTITGLNSHTTLHTGNRPFKCDVCHKTFAHMSSLSVHRWVHVVDKPHKCDICPKAFGLKAQLKAHSKVHTGRDKYLCNVCGKAFYDLRSLTRHKATHSGERRYGCEVCGKRFKIIGTLKSHEKIHTVRDRPYLCDICCKTFVSNCGLTAHMKTHSNVRPFVCIICSKGFISNGELRAHMRVHTGEAPYGCSDCGRFFKRKTHLNNHVRSHLGIKLFVCSVCGKACSRQEHLTVHMRTHNGERPYKCTLCDKAFTQGHCLKTHMKSHRAEENTFLNPSTS